MKQEDFNDMFKKACMDVFGMYPEEIKYTLAEFSENKEIFYTIKENLAPLIALLSVRQVEMLGEMDRVGIIDASVVESRSESRLKEALSDPTKALTFE